MSWRDRDYHRADYRGAQAIDGLLRILNGAVPLGRWFGIRVRVHASLVILIAATLLLDYGQGYSPPNRLASMGFLFLVILLHEFGHCLAARLMGGDADEILMWPLGGLAMTDVPQRPWPSFAVSAAGPLVNVLICAAAALVLWLMNGSIAWNPFSPLPASHRIVWTQPAFYVHWLFVTSYILLLFNLLPMYPLDGGQILQSVLWRGIGYYRSMLAACNAGIVGAGALVVFALLSGAWFLILIALYGLTVCLQQRRMLKQAGPELLDSGPWAEGAEPPARRLHRKLRRRLIRKLQRRARREQREQARVDAILEKVSARGMASLTWWERRILRKATLRKRRSSADFSRADAGG